MMIGFCVIGSDRCPFWPAWVFVLGGTGRDADAHVRVTTFLAYFSDFRSNIKVFGQNNVFFQLLQQKPCRIIMKFRQKPYFEHKTCEIGPKL